MRIASLEVIPYALPFREPYVTARGTPRAARDGAAAAAGRARAWSGSAKRCRCRLRGGAALAEVVAELEGARASCDAAGRGGAIAARRRSRRPARCAALTALLDLRGRRAARRRPRGPRGGRRPNRSAATRRWSPASPPRSRRTRERWAGEGFSTFKLKVGAGEDVAQVRAVREALGAEARIRVDANGAWDVDDRAGALLAELEPLDVELAEQPVGDARGAGASWRGSTSIPIAADESVESRADAGARPRPAPARWPGQARQGRRPGGGDRDRRGPALLPLERARRPGRDRRRRAGRADARSARGVDLAHGLATQRLFSATVAAVECELRTASSTRPPGPGLGVEIDEEALQAHRI